MDSEDAVKGEVIIRLVLFVLEPVCPTQEPTVMSSIF